MCLIIAGKSGQIRSTLLNTKGMLEDIYKSNSDGWGVMYKNKKGLKIVKVLTNSLPDVVRLVDSFPQDDRNLVLHARMKTHGDINLDNCHPYVVIPGKLAMAHNGVLATGNDADPTRSDTYHFIQDYLLEPLGLAPALVHTESFKELLGEYIDSNRFVFMDDEGQMAIINADQGIEHAGMWFSNTYAWSPEMLIPGYRAKYTYYRGFANASASEWDMYDTEWEDYYKQRGSNVYTKATREVCGAGTELTHYKAEDKLPVWGDDDAEDFIDAVLDGEVEAVARAFKNHPLAACRALEESFIPVKTESVRSLNGKSVLSAREQHILDEIIAGRMGLAAHGSPQTTAEVACYYVEWWDRVEWCGRRDSEKDQQADDPLAADGREFAYHNNVIRTMYEPSTGAWGYSTFNRNNEEIDSGYGYESPEEALRWAVDSADDSRAREAMLAEEATEMQWAH